MYFVCRAWSRCRAFEALATTRRWSSSARCRARALRPPPWPDPRGRTAAAAIADPPPRSASARLGNPATLLLYLGVKWSISGYSLICRYVSYPLGSGNLQWICQLSDTGKSFYIPFCLESRPSWCVHCTVSCKCTSYPLRFPLFNNQWASFISIS